MLLSSQIIEYARHFISYTLVWCICTCWIFGINMVLICLSILILLVTGSWWICNGRRVWCASFGRTWACKGFIHAMLESVLLLVLGWYYSNPKSFLFWLDFCSKEVQKYMLNFWEEASHVMRTTWQSLIQKVLFFFNVVVHLSSLLLSSSCRV